MRTDVVQVGAPVEVRIDKQWVAGHVYGIELLDRMTGSIQARWTIHLTRGGEHTAKARDLRESRCPIRSR